MRILVVYCHPVPESFCASVRDVAVRTLEKAGHDVDLLDLYAERFDPVMPADERRHYNEMKLADHPYPDHAERLRAAEGLLFVYPTWWYGLPAMLKGWLDRVLVPYATFALPTATEPMRGTLENIRRLSIVTTAGAPTLYSKLVGEPGRRTILRGMRALCHRRCRTDYVALHRIDSADAATCARFVTRVEALIARY